LPNGVLNPGAGRQRLFAVISAFPADIRQNLRKDRTEMALAEAAFTAEHSGAVGDCGLM
jgi:hypothetical protein